MNSRISRRNACLALGACVTPSSRIRAQSPADNERVYMSREAGREARIREGARREGTLVLYTSLAPPESGPLTQAFEKKTGVKVELWRANSEKVTQRVITEARARRFAVDAVETIGTDLERMAREKIFAEFYSPHIADLAPSAIPAHRAWMPDRLSYLGVAYNARLVRPAELPKTVEGFLDPKWRGRLGMESSDTVWLAGIVKAWGNERGMRFIQRLADMKPDVRTGHTLLTQLVSAGEVPVGLTVYSSGVTSAKRAGAPIEWAPVEPVIAQPLGVGLARYAPHPHAALLFADYLISPEGQELFSSLGRPPANPKFAAAGGAFDSVMMDPGVEIDENAGWEKIWNGLFLNR
jgi:iron(III) transport system substrate-binding protein